MRHAKNVRHQCLGFRWCNDVSLGQGYNQGGSDRAIAPSPEIFKNIFSC